MKAFFERWTVAAAIAIVLAGCVDAGDRLREIARVRFHLERVERELLASTPAGLNAAQTEKRALVIQNLHRYINAGQYPTNLISQEITPIFIDGDGARCAVAALLEASGHHALVERIAGTQNLAYVEELKDEPELQAWLTDNGITLVEAARIQPGYTPPSDSWGLTAMLFGSVQGGAQAVLAPGARVGIRNSYAVPRGSACDHCVDRSWALVAEYRRDFLLGLGSTNQASLLGQIELDGFRQPGHFNFVLGPVASFDEGNRPGRGYGGQLGFGYSLRRFSIRDQIPLPFFVEVISSLIHFDDGFAFHAGANIGVVWFWNPGTVLACEEKKSVGFQPGKEILASSEQVKGRGVPERVGADVLAGEREQRGRRLAHVALHDPQDPEARQRIGQKNWVSCRVSFSAEARSSEKAAWRVVEAPKGVA